MLEDLPMYCPHYKTGCRQVFSKSENLEDHRKGCVFRPVYCPLIICEEKVLFLNITEHLTSEHSDLLEKVKSSVSMINVENKKCSINLPVSSIGWIPIKIRKANRTPNKIDKMFKAPMQSRKMPKAHRFRALQT